MDFSVNNNKFIRRIENEPSEKMKSGNGSQTQGENLDYTNAYRALGASSMANFKVSQAIGANPSLPTTRPVIETYNDFMNALVEEYFDSATVNKILKEKFGFSDADIKEMREKQPELNKLITIHSFFDQIDKFHLEDADKEEFKEQILETSFQEVEDELHYFNHKNIKLVQDLFGIEDEVTAIKTIKSLAKLKSLSTKEACDHEFKTVLKINKESGLTCIPDLLESIYHYNPAVHTIEKLKAYKTLYEPIIDDFDFWKLDWISDVSQITPEFVKEFQENYRALQKLGIKPAIDSSNSRLNADVLKKVKDSGLDFYLSDNGRYVTVDELNSVFEQGYGEKLQSLMKKLAPESKKMILGAATGLGVFTMYPSSGEDIAELFETVLNLKTQDIKDNSYYGYLCKEKPDDLIGTFNPYIEDSFKNVSDLLKAFDKIGVFPNKIYSTPAFFDIPKEKQNDAVEYVNNLGKVLLKDQGKKSPYYGMLFSFINEFSSETDFENANKVLKEVEKRNLLKEISYNELKLMFAPDYERRVGNFEIIRTKLGSDLDRIYVAHNDLKTERLEELVDKLKPMVLNHVKEKFPELEDFDEDILLYFSAKGNPSINALIHKTEKMPETSVDAIVSSSDVFFNDLSFVLSPFKKEFVENLWNESNMSKDIIFNTVQNTTEENIGLAKKLSEYEDFDKTQIYRILGATNSSNVDFIEKVCFDEKFKDNQASIGSLAEVVNDKTLGFAEELYESKKFDIGFMTPVLRNLQDYNINFARQICFDEELEEITKKNILDSLKPESIAFAQRLYDYKSFPRNLLYETIGYSNSYNIGLAEKLYKDKDFPNEEIRHILSATGWKSVGLAEKLCFDKNLGIEPYGICKILSATNQCTEDIAERLCHDERFKKDIEFIESILRYTNVISRPLAEKLCFDKELDFDVRGISTVLSVIRKDNIAFVEKLCFDKKYKNLPEVIKDIAAYVNEYKQDLAEKLCFSKDFPPEKISTILQCANEHNLKIVEKLCFDKELDFPKDFISTFAARIQKKEAEKIEKLLDNPSMRKFLVNNAKNGLYPKDIIVLAKTQNKLNAEAEVKQRKAEKVNIEKSEPKPILEATSDDIDKAQQILVDMGVHPKMAPNYIKLCQENGIVDYLKLDAVCALAKVNVPFKEFKNIFNIAVGSPLSRANGQFRIDIIKDIVLLTECGIDDAKLTTNLAATKNMSDVELHSRINTKVRTDMAERLDNLPDEIKQKMMDAGFDLDSIKEKTLAKPKNVKVNQELVPKEPITLRSLDSIVGPERVVLNRFKTEVPQETWQNPEAFKKWAEDKLESIINKEKDFELNVVFQAQGQYSAYNNARKEGIKSWYEYLINESNYKDDVFTHLLVMDGITKEMKPNTAYTPPAVSHGSFEATYNALLQENTKVSFSEIYAQKTKAKAIEKYSKGVQTVDGIEGQWVTIPKSQKDQPNYNEHIAMVQALSEGSSWCLRFDNAHTYLQNGNLHFFLDKNGNVQTAINETNRHISQIQKRYNQDSTVPIPYVNVIDEYINRPENQFGGIESKMKAAADAKPKFDEQKEKIALLMKEKNYQAVFEELDIETKVKPDGSLLINQYIPIFDRLYTLFDMDVDENELMSNVSEIKQCAYFDGSALTQLPKLRYMGEVVWGDSNISDIRNLERIGREPVYWDKG